MIKRYCDRCGQQIDEGVHAWYVLELHGTDGEFRHKELCEECYAYLCEKDEVPMPQTYCDNCMYLHCNYECAGEIVHKMIDDAVIAEDAYPDLRQKMHDAVDEYEPQTIAEDINRKVEMGKKEWNARHIEDEPQTERSE